MAEESNPQLLEPRFVEVLNKVVSSLPNDDSVIGSVRKRLETIWLKPRLGDISKVLCKPPLTIGEAREMIFFPQPQHATNYCALIKPPVDDSEDNPQVKVQIEFLTILYLLHIPHGSWANFIEPFVLSGGLDCLAMSFVHPNLYLRGQAVDAFLQITASKAFDWWAPISLSSSGKLNNTSQIGLHLKLLELSRSEHFIPGLQVNADSSQSWPGGPTQCLQLLAFWLSWCRNMYTIGQTMQLSRSLLASIQEWGESRSEANAALARAYEDVDSAIIPPELIEFRSRMYADFGRESPIEGPEFQGGVRCAMVKGLVFPNSAQFTKNLEPVIELGENGSFDISDDSSSPLPPPSSSASSEIQPPLPSQSNFVPTVTRDFSCVDIAKNNVSARERGNKAFAKGELDIALSAYDEALAQMKAIEGRELAVIQCNRATVLLALSKGVEEGSDKRKLLLASSVEASRLSVAADKTYAKGCYRLAQCLEASGCVREALTALRSSQILMQNNTSKAKQRKTSQVPKSELAEVAATEKLLVHLMEKLALEMENQAVQENLNAESQNEEDEENVDNIDLAIPNEPMLEKCDKALEMEASILMKILRRKDASTRHDYLSQRSKAPETPIEVMNQVAEEESMETKLNEVEEKEEESMNLKSPPTTTADDSSEQNALVAMNHQKNKYLSDREVNILAEDDSERLARNMVELSKGEDSDDDDVIARLKQQKQKKLKQKMPKKEVVTNDDGDKLDPSLSQSNDVDENFITTNMLSGEELKGQNILKKFSHSSTKTKSKQKVSDNKKELKEKKEKKSQMDELRRIASSAPNSFSFD